MLPILIAPALVPSNSTCGAYVRKQDTVFSFDKRLFGEKQNNLRDCLLRIAGIADENEDNSIQSWASIQFVQIQENLMFSKNVFLLRLFLNKRILIWIGNKKINSLSSCFLLLNNAFLTDDFFVLFNQLNSNKSLFQKYYKSLKHSKEVEETFSNNRT